VNVPGCRIRTTCRLCEGPLAAGLSLTPTPPANELVTREFVESGAKQDTFPLDVMVCETCAHVQLSAVVDPARLFRNYPYRSGASAQFVAHLHNYADDILERFKPRKVLEIGSNDGTMLARFKAAGCACIGVEPDAGAAAASRNAGIMTACRFFDAVFAAEYGPAAGPFDAIIANHVFAHADDLRGMATAVKSLLAPGGVFVFEVGYLLDMVERTQFDCVYHEHLSYHHLGPLVAFFRSVGMTITDAERVDTQGGALRCYVICAGGNFVTSDRMRDILSGEYAGYRLPASVQVKLARMGERIEERRQMLGETVAAICRLGERLAAYGAPAKAVTFLHQMGLGAGQIDFSVDDNPLKHGLFIPGKRIPILPTRALYDRKPDYCLVLGWNFAEQIMKNNERYAHEGGTWVIPLPELRMVQGVKVKR
jgi:C-methyltransferase-like protein/methyltransferase family protein/putative zinc binding protein